ncbi:Rieske 2Fe-2S domain-containing protein [Roseomonas sp. NAR14]|uniref:Rieske 2Fe-2S domain-containing protein n=1 Tax=Roseomonas acroporae TaxID=2937791 RepID=A0A9X2BV60_9PROT|nr:Rieske 2Fe-2S domain-containing protein [Roseomonas acroporae]MCK8784751.1 Rieske 2Fe-2S domain-containing protein [Roseomonas acroporae]
MAEMDEVGARLGNVDYTSAGPGTPGGIFLRRFWQPVYVSRELKPGKAKPIHIMGERFTLFRGKDGVARVVGFRCAHRSTQLSTGWVEQDSIRCLYHGWRFDGAGACVERPAENPCGPAPSIRIPAYPTREHQGLVYAYLGEGEPPAFPPFPAFPEEGVIENSRDLFPCNWFQTYENQTDEVHIAFVHSPGGSHRDLGREQQLPELWPEDAPFGMIRRSRVPGGPVRSTLYLFPNTMRIIIPGFNGLEGVGGWRDTYITLVPTDDENHLLFMTQHARVSPAEMPAYEAAQQAFQARCAAARPAHEVAQDILDGKLDLSDVLDHPRLLVIEDAVAQQGQGRIVDRSLERLAHSDICIVRLRRLFKRELTAIAQGQRGSDWVYSGERPDRGF